MRFSRRQAGDNGGRLVVYSACLPTLGPGKLTNREDVKVLGTDKERELFNPQHPFYVEKAAECIKHGICVDMFVCHHTYADCATLGPLCHRTGGALKRLFGFQSHLHTSELVSETKRIAERKHGYDAMMRVRTSSGLRPTDFFGAFSMSNTTDIEFAGIDEDKSVVVECKYDDKLPENGEACFQAALLYTTPSGERVIRVHTLSLGVATQIVDVFRGTDMPAIMNTLTRSVVRNVRQTKLTDLRDQLTKRCIQMLSSYRKHCTAPNTAMGQLILPECLKLLPLYTCCLHKKSAFRSGSTVSPDERMEDVFALLSMPIATFMVQLYPRLVQVDDVVPAETGIPSAVRVSYERLKEYCGLHMRIHIRRQRDGCYCV